MIIDAQVFLAVRSNSAPGSMTPCPRCDAIEQFLEGRAFNTGVALS